MLNNQFENKMPMSNFVNCNDTANAALFEHVVELTSYIHDFTKTIILKLSRTFDASDDALLVIVFIELSVVDLMVKCDQTD